MNSFQEDALQSTLKAKQYLKPLLRKLLSIGGDVACLWPPNPVPTEDALQEFLANAKLRSGRNAKLKKMIDNSCHENSCTLAQKPGLTWITGWALSSDSIWRPHSWIWDSKKNRIVETTVRRVKYWGMPVGVAK